MAAGVVAFVVLSASVAAVASRGPAAASAPRFRATVRAQSRIPLAGTNWRFVVRAVDSAGRPVQGTALVRVFAGGGEADTVGMFGFKGVLRRTYRWSPDLRGLRAVLQARVTGPGGARTVRYPVRVSSISGSPRFRATLSAPNHTPTAGVGWRFVVRAAGTTGKPFSGTAIVRVLAGGKVVDTIGWFGFKGLLVKTYRWSVSLKGSGAILQARVIGPGGSRTVNYAVRVR